MRNRLTFRIVSASKFLPVVGLIILLTTLNSGCGASRDKGAGRTASDLQSNLKVAKAPALNVLENEAFLRGSQAIIGGTVQNVSGQKIDNLIVDIELSRRGENEKTVRQVQIMPSSLSAGEEGKYSLTVSNREWSGSKILRIRSSSQDEAISFTSQPGAKRPPERLPEGKVVVVQRSKPSGEEFINSPDNPDPIR